MRRDRSWPSNGLSVHCLLITMSPYIDVGRFTRVAVAIFGLFLLAGPTSGETLRGKVVAVADGDTFHVTD